MVCGRRGCGRHGHRLWPSWFVAVVAVAVMVCGRHGIGSNKQYYTNSPTGAKNVGRWTTWVCCMYLVSSQAAATVFKHL